MSIKLKIVNSLKDAMRARNQEVVGTLRLITAGIKQVEVDERIEVDDARILIILDKMAKQRRESIEQFKVAGRDDLVSKEEFELGLINHYLPEPLSEEEINSLITQALLAVHASSASDIGKVMAHLKPQMQGRVDMSKVSVMVKSKLS